jgi:hypothetical protein
VAHSRYGRAVPDDDREPTAALTSRAAVVMAVLLFVAIVLFVLLTQG